MNGSYKLCKKVCQHCRKTYKQYKNSDEIYKMSWIEKRDDWYWKKGVVLCPGELLPKHYHGAPFNRHIFTSSLFPNIPNYCPFVTEHLTSLENIENGNKSIKSI